MCVGVASRYAAAQLHAGLRVEMDIGDDRRDWLLTREWTGLATQGATKARPGQRDNQMVDTSTIAGPYVCLSVCRSLVCDKGSQTASSNLFDMKRVN